MAVAGKSLATGEYQHWRELSTHCHGCGISFTNCLVAPSSAIDRWAKYCFLGITSDISGGATRRDGVVDLQTLIFGIKS